MITFTMKVIFLDYLILMGFFLFGISVNAILNIRCHDRCKNNYVLRLSDLSITLKYSGQHMALSLVVTLSISLLRYLDIEANKFYDRAH